MLARLVAECYAMLNSILTATHFFKAGYRKALIQPFQSTYPPPPLRATLQLLTPLPSSTSTHHHNACLLLSLIPTASYALLNPHHASAQSHPVPSFVSVSSSPCALSRAANRSERVVNAWCGGSRGMRVFGRIAGGFVEGFVKDKSRSFSTGLEE